MWAHQFGLDIFGQLGGDADIGYSQKTTRTSTGILELSPLGEGKGYGQVGPQGRGVKRSGVAGAPHKMTGRWKGITEFIAAAVLFAPAMFLVHGREVVSVRSEAERWRWVFDKNEHEGGPAFRVFLAAADGCAHPAGILKRSVTRNGDEAVVATDFTPAADATGAARGFSFRQETVVRRDTGIIRFSADIYLPGGLFSVHVAVGVRPARLC
jgi:hypothetical protein